MTFSKRLLDGIQRGRIKLSIRVWTRPHVKVGGRYPVGEGHIAVDAITPLDLADVTHDLACESGFKGVQDLLGTARHGTGDNVYLIRFHYLRPGAWEEPGAQAAPAPSPKTLLQRIRSAPARRTPPRQAKRPGGNAAD